MYSYVMKALGVSLILCLFFSCKGGELQVMELQCEYEVNPLSVEEEAPLLRWQLCSAVSGKSQEAYGCLWQVLRRYWKTIKPIVGILAR